ncbi:hypothetical protein NP233_g12780 [Leucocoprinus birnbaumii]|uniref:DUF6533 domain-containing protein n=1 Tax=Leucocoprinus birnbaumii TaxID=56174 RepID=A0AAD5VF45_9AGAR|nr:hypothetical protein NP233_g12780 [Leucocoprinus birnbaumii]
MRLRQSCDVAGLSLLVYDFVLSWANEFRFIWKHRNADHEHRPFIHDCRETKCRLPAVVFIQDVHPSPASLEHGACYDAPGFRLYERKPMLGICLGIWFLISRALNVWNGIDAVNDMKPDSLCNIQETPDSSLWFSLTIIINQLVLWLLIMDKYRNAHKAQWSMPPLLRIVMRDSSWVFVVLTGKSNAFIDLEFDAT